MDDEGMHKLQQDVASMKRIVEDVPSIKQDLIQIKQLLVNLPANLQQHTERLELPGTSESESVDLFSETASTISMASTGSEDETAKQHTLRTKCMSEAIQRHFVDIVRQVPFDAIVDKSLEKDLVTTKENERFREFRASEDKMRSLIRNIMYKDVETMLAFLSMLSEYDKSLTDAIYRTFNIRYKIDDPTLTDTTCTSCLIQKRVSIKMIGDHFFSRELISRDLHRNITDCLSTTGNNSIWQRFFEEISHSNPEHVIHALKEFLTDGEGEKILHYKDITQHIEKDIRRHRKSFKCRCSQSGKRSISPAMQAGHQTVAKRLYSSLQLPGPDLSPSSGASNLPASQQYIDSELVKSTSRPVTSKPKKKKRPIKAPEKRWKIDP